MVIQIGALKSGRDADVPADIARRRRRRPRGRGDRQGHLRERLPDRRREGPGLPADRGGRRRLRQDVDRLRPERRDPRRPAPDAGEHVAAHPGQGRRRRPDARRAARGHGPRRDPVGATATDDDPRRLPGPEGRRRRRRRPAPAPTGRAEPTADDGGRAGAAGSRRSSGWPRRRSCSSASRRPRREAIETASHWCADAIAADGLVHLFGTGHSRIPVEEMFPRYGSYPGFNPMVELSMTFHTQVVGANGQRQAMFIERTPGLAEVILVELHVRAERRDDGLLGQRALGGPGRDGPRRPPARAAGRRRDLRRPVAVRRAGPGRRGATPRRGRPRHRPVHATGRRAVHDRRPGHPGGPRLDDRGRRHRQLHQGPDRRAPRRSGARCRRS